MVWVIYVSTWCFWISNCILYNIFILITKRYFCFVLYPQTIHQQAEDWKWWSVEEGHYDFYYPQHHFIYVLMSPFIINLFLYLLYLCSHFNSSKHSSASAGVQGAFTAFLWRMKSADQPFISVTFLSVSPLCTRSCSAHRAKSGAWTRSVIMMLYALWWYLPLCLQLFWPYDCNDFDSWGSLHNHLKATFPVSSSLTRPSGAHSLS